MDSKPFLPDKNAMRLDYDKHFASRHAIAAELETSIEDALKDLPSRVLVKARIKTFESYYKKYLKLLKSKPADKPLNDMGLPLITDIIGVRIICPFLEDLRYCENTLNTRYEVTQVERKQSRSFREFGYQSLHLLIKIPPSLVEKHGSCASDVAEIQIRSILQDAWAEVEHELVYKAEFTPFDEPMKRKLAAVNAMLTLADTIFQEIRAYQRQLHGQLDKRRGAFFQQIEDETDAKIFAQAVDGGGKEEAEAGKQAAVNPGATTIDDLLLNALYAHNRGQFDDAIAYYTRILAMQPNEVTQSLIYKHRGMANFAQRHYDEAIKDFSAAYEADKSSYKALYYRGVVRSVKADYAKALSDFSESLKINPYQAFCLYRRSQAYYHLGDLPAALADSEAALKLESGNKSMERLRNLILSGLKM